MYCPATFGEPSSLSGSKYTCVDVMVPGLMMGERREARRLLPRGYKDVNQLSAVTAQCRAGALGSLFGTYTVWNERDRFGWGGIHQSSGWKQLPDGLRSCHPPASGLWPS